jgi:hypothetical protein
VDSTVTTAGAVTAWASTEAMVVTRTSDPPVISRTESASTEEHTRATVPRSPSPALR